MTFLFLLTALTAELRRPSSRRRESNSRPFTKQEGITVTLRRASSPNMDWSSASFMTSAVILTISKPPNSLRAVPHPRVPDTCPLVYNNVAPKKQRCYPRNRTRDLPITRWLFCPIKLSSFVFQIDIICTFRFSPPTLLSYYRIVASRLIYYDFPVSSECSLPLSYDDRQAAEENRTLDLSRNRRGSRWLYAVPLHQIWNMEFGF